MYSPKIAEDLIPALYQMRKERKMPMTRLVNLIIRNALTVNETSENKPEFNNLNFSLCNTEPRDAA